MSQPRQALAAHVEAKPTPLAKANTLTFGKLGHNNQGIYIDPARECVGVYFSASVLPNYPIGYMTAAEDRSSKHTMQ